jgi:ATP-dependent Clp protease ATP-binding subunit ClpC
MFERYTEKARRVIFFGRYEASQFGSPYIETEHLLLGLLREDKALTNRFLRSHASIESIRKQIQERTPIREKVSTATDLPLSEECKRVLAYAAEESERLAHKHIGTEHLLLGLLREDKSFAAQILHERGLRLSTVREDLRRAPSEQVSPSQPKEIPPLSVVSRDLTAAARENELDPLIGREEELESVIRALCRRTKNNVVLVGEPGVGKTAIVHGLARRIASGEVPSRLETKRLVALDLTHIVAVGEVANQPEQPPMADLREYIRAYLAKIDPVSATKRPRAELKELTEAAAHLASSWFPRHSVFGVLKELMEAANLIVFIEDLFTKAAAPGSLYLVKLLKPLLTRGQNQCIGVATPGDYRKAIEEEPWLKSCFSAVEVGPADEAEALKILAGIKPIYEEFHGVVYTDEALQYAVYHSQRYIQGRYLPAKAIDLIDEAGAAVALHAGALPEEVIDIQKRVKFIEHRKVNALANHEFEKAKFYEEEERKERENLQQLRAKYNLGATPTVTLDDIENVLARGTGVPIDKIRQERGSAGPIGPGGGSAA